MNRPFGVTILSVVMIAAGLGFGGAAVVFFRAGSKAATAVAPSSGISAASYAALGAAAGVIFLLFGGLHIVLALGILGLRNLARVLTIFLFVLIGAGACLGLAATLLSYSHIAVAWNVTLLALAVLAVWYLLRPQTKEAFHA